MSEPEKVIDRLRFWLAGLLVLKHGVPLLTAWAFLWGAAVLVLRATLGVPPWPLLWGLAAAPLAIAPAFFVAARRLPGRTALRALLDRRSGCGGLLMAAEEQHLGRWQAALPEILLPRVRWHGLRACALLAMAGSFVLVAFLVPAGFANLQTGPTLEVGREADKLAKRIEVLKEEAVLDPARADSLAQKLDQVREQASGKDPVKTLEALDHLQEVTSQAAKEAEQSAVRKAEEMTRAEALAEALKEAGPDLSPQRLAEAMNELAALTKKAAEENDVLRKRLDPKTAKVLASASLDPETLKKLSRAMREGKTDLAERLAKLQKAGLLDREALERLAKCGECSGEALTSLLKEGAGKMSVAEMVGLCEGCNKEALADFLRECQGNKPGRGGITRGPGAASLTFGKPTSEEGFKFKEEVLPPSSLEALKKSKVINVGRVAPKVGDPIAPAEAGALAGAAVGGGAANTQVVLPRHRAAVERYFERPGK
jgi:hypothetical protein